MKKILASFVLLGGLITPYAYSQGFFSPYQGSLKSKVTLGAGIGLSYLNTDAVGTTDFGNQSILTANAAGSISYRFTNNMSFRLNGAVGRLRADPTRDEIFKAGLRDFKTTYMEASAMLELDWFSKIKFDGGNQRLSLSNLFGVGYMAYYPYEINKEQSLRGRPFSTDRKNYAGYSTFAMTYLIGGNMKFYISPQFSIGLEGLYRFSDTDFVDGFKAGKATDGFATLIATAYYTLEPGIRRFNYRNYLKKYYRRHPWR